MYRRNRFTLRVVNECPPLHARESTMPLHSREASTSLPPVDDNVPSNGDSLHREDLVVIDDVSSSRVVSSPARLESVRRGTRSRKLPSYLADYKP